MTVNTAVNSGLFGHAKNAASKWEKAQKDEQLEGIGDYIEEQVNDGSYILGLCWNSNVKKYFDRENIFNAFYIVCNSRTGENLFRNYLNLNILTEAIIEDNGTVADSSWEKFNENVKSGFLCDEEGYVLKGWYTDSETGEIKIDIVMPLNIEYEVEGKERIGTEIDEAGKVWAKFSDGSKNIICQIPVASFARSNTLTKVETNLYQANSGTGEFDGIGIALEKLHGSMKRINKITEEKIKESNEKIRETKYTLSVEDSTKDYYFVLYDGTKNVFIKNQISLYEGEAWNAAIGKPARPGGPFYEEDRLVGLCDENCNLLMVYQVNEKGEIEYDKGLDQFRHVYENITIVNEETMMITELIKTYIKEDGKIYGLYDNGTEKILAQIALSTSNTELELVRDNPIINISKP